MGPGETLQYFFPAHTCKCGPGKNTEGIFFGPGETLPKFCTICQFSQFENLHPTFQNTLIKKLLHINQALSMTKDCQVQGLFAQPLRSRKYKRGAEIYVAVQKHLQIP